MKNLFALSSLLLLVTFSCSKSDSEDANPSVQNQFSAKLNGDPFSASFVFSGLNTLVNQIQISATSNEQTEIGLVMPNDIEPGTYTLIFNFANQYSGYYERPEAELTEEDDVLGHGFSETGTLTITQHDVANRKLVGTFDFATYPYESDGSVDRITEGSFDVVYEIID